MTQHANSGLLSMASTLQKQAQTTDGIEGIVQAGSYNPADGTIQAVMCHTVAAAAFKDSAGNQIYPTIVGASLETNGYGDQYGPVGGERCILRMAGNKYMATLEHHEDDSPGAPSGERWSVHRAMPSGNTPGEINAWWKLTNDGATTGDKLGGYKVLTGGLGLFETTDGISLSLNDTTHAATLSGALSVLLENTAGASIALSGGHVFMNGATAATADGIARQSDLVALLFALQSALSTWASTSLQGGSGASGPTLSFIPTASTASFAV